MSFELDEFSYSWPNLMKKVFPRFSFEQFLHFRARIMKYHHLSHGELHISFLKWLLELFFFLILFLEVKSSRKASGGGYLGKTGDGYVRAIRVPFFIPQKSLKGLEIHKWVSERVPKSRKSKISFSKGHNFRKFWPKLGESRANFSENRAKFWEKSL